MENPNYRPRILDQKLEDYLAAFGAVCIEGPKWCGKTWTASYHCGSQIFLGDPAGNFQNRHLAELSPELILEGDAPRLIDEWQEVPPLWDAVRFQVDKTPTKGRFLLTGSATPNHKGILHSGAGRIGRLRMRPMSLYESGDSNGAVSLKRLCEGTLEPVFTGNVRLQELIALILRGGWPGSLELPLQQAMLLPQEYWNAVLEDDVYRLDGIRRNPSKLRLLLRSLARNESTTASNKTLLNDIRTVEEEDLDANTVSAYLDVFQRLFLLDNQRPFAWGIRSSVRVKQGEKRHFADPSLACALLGCTPEGLLGDLETLGFLFEALCERDLRIYGESFGAQLYHYQDYKGREVDAVLELSDGRWTALEIKLGANQIDKAAAGLLKLRREMEEDPKGRPPAVLGVVCGLSSAAYRRPDGVFVVPITALKP